MVKNLKLLLFVFVFCTMASVGFSVDVDSCMNINVNGTYEMNQSIVVLGANCFNVTAQNVTFDCDGYSVNSSWFDGYLFVLENSSNLTIKSCDFDDGKFNIFNSSDFLIYNNTFDNVSFEIDVGSSDIDFNMSFVGNYWDDLVCSETITIGNYFRCVVPANYTVNLTLEIYDYAPLVNESVIPAPVDTSLGPVVDSCGLINSSGIYVLNESLSSLGYCVNVTANNVVLDCAGFDINGSGLGVGVDLYAVNGFSMLNCNVHNFTDAVRGEGLVNGFFENVSVLGSYIGVNLSVVSSENVFINLTALNNDGDVSIRLGSTQNQFNESLIGSLFVVSGTNSFVDMIIDEVLVDSSGNDFVNVSVDDVWLDSDSNVFEGGEIMYTLLIDSSYNMFFKMNLSNVTVSSTDWNLVAYNEFNYSQGGVSLGNYWGNISCLESEARGDYFVCLNPSSYSYNNVSDVIDYAPIVFSLINYSAPVVFDQFDNTSRDFKFKLKFEDDFDDDVNCSIVIDDEFERYYLFTDLTSSENLTILKHMDEELALECDDKVEEISFRVYDEDGWIIFDEDYDDEDEFGYEVGDDRFKLFIEVDDFDEDDNIDCELILDDDDTFEFDFDEDTTNDELEITKYFEEEVEWECDETIDEINFVIEDWDADEVLDEEYEDNDYFEYIVGEGMYRLEIIVEDYDEDDNPQCELTIDSDDDFDYDFDEDTPSDDLEIVKFFEEEFVWDCDEVIDDMNFKVFDEVDKELLDEDKNDVELYTFNIDEILDDEVEENDSDDSSSSGSSSSGSSDESDESSYSDDLQVRVGLEFDSFVIEEVDFSDSEDTVIDVDSSWFEKVVVKSKKSVADSSMKFKRESFNVVGVKVRSSSVEFEVDSNEFDVYDMVVFENDVLSNDDVESVNFRFKVQKSWLLDRNFSSSEVYLVRSVNGGLDEELDVEVVDMDMDYVYFESFSSGFSTYTILAKKDRVEEFDAPVVVGGEDAPALVSAPDDDSEMVDSPSVSLGADDVDLEEDETSWVVTLGKLFVALLLLVAFIWLIK